MNDTGYKKLARLIVDWSIHLKPNQKVVINAGSPLSLPLAEEVYKQVLRVGGIPYLNLGTDSLDHFFYQHATTAQLQTKPAIALFTAKWADKFVSIVAEKNPFELNHADPRKVVLRTKMFKPVKDIILSKPWVLTYLPTPAMAQSSSVSPTFKTV